MWFISNLKKCDAHLKLVDKKNISDSKSRNDMLGLGIFKTI